MTDVPEMRQVVEGHLAAERRVLEEKLGYWRDLLRDHKHDGFCRLGCLGAIYNERIKTLETQHHQLSEYEEVLRTGTAAELLPVAEELAAHFKPPWGLYLAAYFPSSHQGLGLFALGYAQSCHRQAVELRNRLRTRSHLVTMEGN